MGKRVNIKSQAVLVVTELTNGTIKFHSIGGSEVGKSSTTAEVLCDSLLSLSQTMLEEVIKNGEVKAKVSTNP